MFKIDAEQLAAGGLTKDPLRSIKFERWNMVCDKMDVLYPFYSGPRKLREVEARVASTLASITRFIFMVVDNDNYMWAVDHHKFERGFYVEEEK